MQYPGYSFARVKRIRGPLLLEREANSLNLEWLAAVQEGIV